MRMLILGLFLLTLLGYHQCTTHIPAEYHEKPFVTGVGIISEDMLYVTIQAGEMKPSELVSYDALQGDSVAEKRNSFDEVIERMLFRNGKPVGWIIGEDQGFLRRGQQFMGAPLNLRHVDDPNNYSVTSFATGQTFAPQEVFRKSKPNNWIEPSREFCIGHRIYLKLPEPLVEGNEYTVHLGILNTEEREVNLRFDPATSRNDAIHVSHIGFRPGDPGKRAYLSAWLGTGGAFEYSDEIPFHLLDANTGERVFTGKVKLAFEAGQEEKMLYPKSFSKTNVYHMDFGAVEREGEYVIQLEGLGVSRPFPISHEVWRGATRTAMKGFYHMRANIAMGPPHTSYVRPEGYMPGEQVTVYESATPLMNTGNGLNALGTDMDNFGNLLAGKTEKVFSKGMGGYHDAGDWDRRIQHLYATRLQLELYELATSIYDTLQWNIPESGNELPDMIDEALFNLDFYKQLQDPEGGIRGGIEASSHPVEGETSWQESLTVLVYEPGCWSSFYYAGVAARLAYLVRDRFPELSATYCKSALKAMTWGETAYQQWSTDPETNYKPYEVAVERNLAALELYRVTGDPSWHDLFREQSCLVGYGDKLLPGKITDNTRGIEYNWNYMKFSVDEYGRQRDAVFLYALLHDSLVNPHMKQYATALTIRDAQTSVEYQEGNAFNLTTTDPGRSLMVTFFPVPGSIQLCRGHYLTGHEDFLAAIVRSTQFGLGGNPMNLVYMSGISEGSVKNLFHIDSRLSGQALPAGLIPYGQFDPDDPIANTQEIFMWPFTWYLENVTTPAPLSWPVYEMFYDIYRWPLQTEWTPMQDNGPNAYVWGYLAGLE